MTPHPTPSLPSGEVGEIRRRHEACCDQRRQNDGWTGADFDIDDFNDAHADRATLLAALTASEAATEHWKQSATLYKNDYEVEQRKRLAAEEKLNAGKPIIAKMEADLIAVRNELRRGWSRP